MDATLQCPIVTTVKVIGGKWKPIILWRLRDDPKRFGELKRIIKGITQKMLIQQLRELESDGLVLRTVHQEVPPKVEYRLTDYGQTLMPMLRVMADWGTRHQSICETAPQ